MTRRLYVSDIHLHPVDDPAGSRHLQAFSNLLLHHQRTAELRVDEIYILGDLCEMWIGDDDDSTLVSALTKLFQSLSHDCQLAFLPGNRDFLLGETFAGRTGLQLLSEPYVLTDNTVLVHGDAQCTDDLPYQQLRSVLRSAEWQQDILAKSLEERRAFGQALRETSKQENANKAGNIMDVNAGAIAELVSTTGAGLLIHGHTHRPGLHALANGGKRVVLGAWERCGWWAIQDTELKADENQVSIQLHCAGIEQLCQLG